MKRVLFAIAALLMINVAQAQMPVGTAKTITTADTITVSNIGSGVVSLTAGYLETSGTSAGKFYFEGSGDGRGWTHIDSSKSLSDVTTYQFLTVAVSRTTYMSYRVRCSNTSSATGTLYFTALRRPDERQ